jgi:tetratricopeptide (TPR) repeat protein
MYVKEKRLLSAAEEYRLAINDDPDNPELTWKLARIYYELQLIDDAFRIMQKAIDLSQGTNTAWRTELGELYYNNGRYEEAISQFVKVLEMNPEAANINYYLGKI